MRRSPIIFAILCLAFIPLARADDARKSAKDVNLDVILNAAQTLSQAMMDENFERFTDFTLPQVVEKMGGREKMIAKLKAGMAEMKKAGYAIKTNRVDTPTAVADAGDDIVAIVPQTLVMAVPGGKLTQKSYLIAVSSDGGKNWTFLDGAGVNDTTIKAILPKFPSQLKLPPKETSVFEPDKQK